MSKKKVTKTRKKLVAWQQNLVDADTMSLVDYKKWCAARWNGRKQAPYTLRDDYIMGLGLSGETGEVQELLKKAVRDQKDILKVDKKKLVKELGDVLFYWNIICDRHQIDPQEVIKQNIKKLTERDLKKYDE